VPHHELPTEEELIVWRITGPDALTLEAIVNGLALIWERLPFRDEEIDPDILATWFPETREIARAVRLLADNLVVRATSAGKQTPADAERSNAIASINATFQEARLRLTNRRREDALGDAAAVIREIGYEYGDRECMLATDREGADVIAIVRVARPTAYASLLGRLMQRADSHMATDEALTLERAASTWYFYRWSDGAWEADGADAEFPRSVREHEWSTVSRDTLALDEPVIASLARVSDDGDDDVPPRQRFLADAYAMSTIGIFEVMSVDGRRMTVRDVQDDRTFVVHEHNTEVNLFPGLVILGRLIPIDDGEWLRSPGTLILVPEDDGYIEELASTLATVSEHLPTPIALEALISSKLYGAAVPVDGLAAPTIEIARATLVDAAEVLVDLGLLGEMPDGDVPPDLLEQMDSPALGMAGLDADAPMVEWLAALMSQVALGDQAAERPPRSVRRKRTRAKPKGKKGRKR